MTVWMTDRFFESSNIGYDTVTEKEKRPFWKRIGTADPNVRFLLISLAVTFPTCWLAPGALPR